MKRFFSIFPFFMTLLSLHFTSYSQSLKVDSMTFYKDYFPGTNDINGAYLGSTETMSIVQHHGKLYAGMGNWMDYPITFQSEGTQILRKDTYNSPWVVDTTIGYTSLRSDGFKKVQFTKDYNGNILPNPKDLLVGGFTRTIPPYNSSVWVRNDSTDKWYRNIMGIYSSVPGLTGIRSFHVHTDKITGSQWLFCGTASGAILKAAYNPAKTGMLQIDTIPEIDGLGRIMAMTVCGGSLYASAGVDMVGNDIVGGIYRRIDGTNPTWELVHQWPHDPTINNEQNVMRGITCVPDPKGSNNDVIIGARNAGGLLQVIEPFNNHNVYTELDVTQYFADLWLNGNWPYLDYALIAYNEFTLDTINNQPVWWVSLAIYAPNQLEQPHNGAYFLLRHKDGTYQWGYIYDNNYPVPNGESLRATRTICKSLFPQDGDSTYYFGGYDCLSDTSHNTAWIYKGVLHDLVAGTNDFSHLINNLKIYPNPFNHFVQFDNIPNKSTIQIIDVTGKIMYQENTTNVSSITIQTEEFEDGLYFINILNNGNVITEKIVIHR